MDNEKHIIAQIETYIRQGGGEYGDWYIGLADNPIDPIMEVTKLHKVQNHRFTYIETISHKVAKSVADYFLNVRGLDGNLSDIAPTCPRRPHLGIVDRQKRALYIYKKAVNLVGSESAVPV